MIGKIELPNWVCAGLAALAVAATVTVAAPRPAQAQTQTGDQTQSTGRPPSYLVVRAYYLWDSFSRRTTETALGVDTFTTVNYQGKPGGGADLEYLPIPWLGIDFAVSQTHVQVDERTTTPTGPSFERKANIQVRPFMVGVFAGRFSGGAGGPARDARGKSGGSRDGGGGGPGDRRCREGLRGGVAQPAPPSPLARRRRRRDGVSLRDEPAARGGLVPPAVL